MKTLFKKFGKYIGAVVLFAAIVGATVYGDGGNGPVYLQTTLSFINGQQLSLSNGIVANANSAGAPFISQSLLNIQSGYTNSTVYTNAAAGNLTNQIILPFWNNDVPGPFCDANGNISTNFVISIVYNFTNIALAPRQPNQPANFGSLGGPLTTNGINTNGGFGGPTNWFPLSTCNQTNTFVFVRSCFDTNYNLHSSDYYTFNVLCESNGGVFVTNFPLTFLQGTKSIRLLYVSNYTQAAGIGTIINSINLAGYMPR